MVVAVPPLALAAVVAAALQTYPQATVTDVGSVKAGVLDALWGHPAVNRYVGSHPMAGSQHSGPGHRQRGPVHRPDLGDHPAPALRSGCGR